MQLKSEWIDINNLKEIQLLPSFLNDNIFEMIISDNPKFFGSEHITYNHG